MTFELYANYFRLGLFPNPGVYQAKITAISRVTLDAVRDFDGVLVGQAFQPVFHLGQTGMSIQIMSEPQRQTEMSVLPWLA